MAPKKQKGTKRDDLLAAYRRIRKPMPPPQKVMRDERRKLEDEEARREIEERKRREMDAP